MSQGVAQDLCLPLASDLTAFLNKRVICFDERHLDFHKEVFKADYFDVIHKINTIEEETDEEEYELEI